MAVIDQLPENLSSSSRPVSVTVVSARIGTRPSMTTCPATIDLHAGPDHPGVGGQVAIDDFPAAELVALESPTTRQIDVAGVPGEPRHRPRAVVPRRR